MTDKPGMPFSVVREVKDDAPTPPPTRGDAASSMHAIAIETLMLSLKALSQRALTAASALFTGAALFSAWWLWRSVLPNPSIEQLVGVTLYALFILAIEIVRRRSP